MKKKKRSSSKGLAGKIFKGILEFLLVVLILLLVYNVVTSIASSPSKEAPPEVLEQYAQKGIAGIDSITPLAVKIIVLTVCIIIALLVVLNKRKWFKKFEKNLFAKKLAKKNSESPTIREGVIAIFAFFFWYIFNDALNNHAGSPLGIYEVGVLFGDLGVYVIDFIWLGFFGAFFLMMVLVMRSQWKRIGSISPYDSFMGLFAIASFLLMLIAAVAQLSGVGSAETLLWFGGIAKSTLYHIGTIAFIISLLYYVITEQ